METVHAIVQSKPAQKLGWIVTLPGTRKAHHIYMRFPRDARGTPIKTRPIPAVSRKSRIAADLVSTCLWHPIESQLYLYSLCVDIDISGTSADNIDEQGRICANRLRELLNKELPRSSPLIKLVRSTSGRGIHAWLFFPAFPLNSANSRYERQEAMATKILRGLKRVLQSAGFGADDKALGLHHLYANWRNPDKAIDRDIPFLQARIRRSLDDEHKQYLRVLSLVYRELAAREELKDIFLKPLRKLYRDQRIADKLMSFTLANHAALKRGEVIRLRYSALLEALGVSKNSLPKLIAEVTGDAPTLGIRIERDLERAGYYCVSSGTRFDSIALPAAGKKAGRRTGIKTNSIDVLEQLKFPEHVLDGERNYEVCKAILKLKLSGVPKPEAARIVSVYAQRAIADQTSMTLQRLNDYIDSSYHNHPNSFGCIPGLAPNWLLTITSGFCPKSLKGELQSGFPGHTPEPAPIPPNNVRPSPSKRSGEDAAGRRREPVQEGIGAKVLTFRPSAEKHEVSRQE